VTEPSPFLSFLVPVGPSPDQLRETLLSLAAQSSTSFEVLLLTGVAGTAGVAGTELEDLLAAQPATLRSRLRVVDLSGDGLGGDGLAWLEPALTHARGRYVAISDGLTWFAHFVESCESHAGDGSATLRGLVLHQQAASAAVGGLAGVRGTAPPVRRGGDVFSVLEHLGPDPAASRHGFALPRAVLADLRPDADLGTAALRDLLLRAVARTGVTELGEVVALRCELDGSAQGSEDDAARLLAKVDATGWQLPAGSIAPLVAGVSAAAESGTTAEVAQLRLLVGLKDDHITNIEAQLARLEQRVERLQGQVEKKDATVKRLRAKLGQGSQEGSQEPGPD
jgi:hypothetical protein